MSIDQITTSNTFGQLITATAALIAVANNFTDGPQSQTGSTWTFTNANVGVNVIGTLLSTNANVGILNCENANVTNETIGRSNISTANVTVANVGGATITVLNATQVTTGNANVSGLLQVSDRANIFSANIQTANIGSLSVTTLAVTELTVPVLNASFANITTLSVTGTSQHIGLIATLVTTDNCNVRILNCSTANISNLTAPTVNASFANLTTASIGTLTITTTDIGTVTTGILNASFANLTTANITTANITDLFANVANLLSCNIASGNVTGRMNVASNPTANLEVSTKAYTDIAANTLKVLYTTKGDILVADTAANAIRVGAGVNGQSLIVDTTRLASVRYANRAAQTFRNLSLATSTVDKISNGSMIVVHALDEAVMDDGEVVVGWPNRTVIDINTSGVLGLDTGTLLANTWYEVYAIRKRSDGTKSYIIHRALDRNVGQNTANTIAWTTGTYGSVGANSTVALANARLAQSFTPNVAGPVSSIEIYGFRTSTPTGNIWLTLEANTAGNPSGTTLATSRKYDVARLQITTRYSMRFVFDTTANVAAATSYFWILNSDYAASATAFMNLTYSTTASTGQGGTNVGVPKGNNNVSWADLTPGIGTFIYKVFVEANSTDLTFPTGYDQKCLISYCATDQSNKIREYTQRDRKMQMFFSPQWMGYATKQATTAETADLTNTVPPIQCEVVFLIFGTTVAQYTGIGRLHALDMPQTILETVNGYVPCTSSAGTVAMPPSAPIYVEQQAVQVLVTNSVTKFYTASVTF